MTTILKSLQSPQRLARAGKPALSLAHRCRLARRLVALALLLPAAAFSNCKITTAELPVKMAGMRAIATVLINGTSVPMMVDSGAFYSFLTEAAAAQLKLRLRSMPGRVAVAGLGGRVETSMTTVERLELLGGSVPDVDFIVGGAEPGGGAMGIIGRNILSIADTEYDLAHGAIRLVFPNEDCADANMAYWAGEQPVTRVDLLRDTDDHFKLPAILGLVKVNDQKLVALFDSGAYGSVVSLQAASRVGVAKSDMTSAGLSYGADGKAQKTWLASFNSIAVGDEVIRNNRLRVADFEGRQDAILGVDFFLSHHLYVAKKRRVMFLTYNGGRVFSENVVGSPEAVASAASAGTSADPELDADGYARRGAASASRGEYVQALADLDRACALSPASAALFAQRAEVRLRLKQPDEASADIDKALQLDPQQVDARLQRATMRARSHDTDGALADLAELDRTLAPEAQQRLAMGRLYMTLHVPAQAIPQFDHWIPLHRHEFRIEETLRERCWARVLLGVDLDKALDDCDAAVDADSKNPLFLSDRAWVYLRMGKPKKAVADFDRALALQPHRAWSMYGRGLAHLGLGETAQGQADLAAARKEQATIDAEIGRAGLPLAPAPTPPLAPAPASHP
jgi:tetratricopeptide (TPR) repeat protein/predicted aspartyl protease